MPALRVVGVVALIVGAASWHPVKVAAPARTRLNAIGVLARKMKEAEAKKLRVAVDADAESPIGMALKAAAAGTLPKRADYGSLYSSMRKPRGTLTILAEYHRKVPAALRANGVEEYEIPEITFVSSEVRNSGASVLALNMDKQSGGATLDDFAVALKEQQTAKGNFPGPLPLVWADVVVDEVQLAQAYVAGAHGVTLTLDALGAERCKKLRDDAEQLYGLESVVVVAPALDGDLEGMIKTALEEINATMLMVAGVDADLAIAAKAWIPKTVTAIARINARGGKGLDEAEDAWRLRDAGYDAVWVSDVLYKFGVFSGSLFQGAPDSITSVIKAMKSKASVKYARASGAFSGRGEGSKEYLGDILM